MSRLLLDVLIWPMILAGGILILTCVGIVGLAIFFAVRILRNEKQKTAETDSITPNQSTEETKEP